MTNKSEKVPRHIGLILDGNRRWARQQGLPTLEGHKAGYENLKTISDHLRAKGVEYLTAFVFSTENWKRTQVEIDYLMDMIIWVAKEEVEEFSKRNVRVRFLGSREGLRPDIVEAMADIEKSTADHTAGTISLCLNYGGRAEIVEAAKSALASGVKTNELNEEIISQNLWLPDLPELDLIIRTAAEHRLSNFMLWRAAYSELYFFDTYWPSLTVEEIGKALDWYSQRERRFGGDSQKP